MYSAFLAQSPEPFACVHFQRMQTPMAIFDVFNRAPTLEQVTAWLGEHFKSSPHWLHVADPTRDLMHEFDLPLKVRRKVRQMILTRL